MILLDFDKVVHSFLSLKISDYGFNSQIVVWIDDFLRNRKLRVVLGENISDCLEVLSGSPQGASISPLLFIFYIYVVNSLIMLFADDSKLISIVKNIKNR